MEVAVENAILQCVYWIALDKGFCIQKAPQAVQLLHAVLAWLCRKP